MYFFISYTKKQNYILLFLFDLQRKKTFSYENNDFGINKNIILNDTVLEYT